MTMTDTDPRAAILARIGAERLWWRDLVARIPPDRIEEPGPMGEWTFRDLAVHLLGWRERTISRLEAAVAGLSEPAPPWPADLDDDDVINTWIHEASQGGHADEVLEAIDRSYERLAAAVEALPDAVLTDPAALPWLDGEALADTDLFSHVHDEHVPSIEEWLGEDLAPRPAR